VKAGIISAIIIVSYFAVYFAAFFSYRIFFLGKYRSCIWHWFYCRNSMGHLLVMVGAENMTVFLDLFSGIGGFALGAYWAGLRFDKHYFSEIDDYAVQVYQWRAAV